jgi:hypothetical protein
MSSAYCRSLRAAPGIVKGPSQCRKVVRHLKPPDAPPRDTPIRVPALLYATGVIIRP